MATQENKVGENDEDVGRMSILEIVSKESIEEFFGKEFFGNRYIEKLQCVELLDAVEIQAHAFQDCKFLRTITVPSTCTRIGQMAFAGLPSLEEVTLLGSFTSIDDGAFRRCKFLTRLTISPSSVNDNSYMDSPYIGKEAFEECRHLKTFEGGNRIRVIRESAFAYCESLRSLRLPSSVQLIGESAFIESSIRQVKLHEGLERIDAYAFDSCDLMKIRIPSSVRTIANGTFAACHSLSQVTLRQGLESIKEEAFYGCTSLETIVIPSTVREIAKHAFSGCTSLREITLCEGLESIKEEAFYGCTSLETIVIPSTVREIARAFVGCTSLKEIVVPSAIGEIRVGAFTGCHENLVVRIVR
jgi:hypothetical protein